MGMGVGIETEMGIGIGMGIGMGMEMGMRMGAMISNLLITRTILSSVKYKEKSTINN